MPSRTNPNSTMRPCLLRLRPDCVPRGDDVGKSYEVGRHSAVTPDAMNLSEE